MTQSFNDWLEDNPNKSYANIYELGLVAYKAGQQSRQAEIDELQKRIDDALKELEMSDSFEQSDVMDEYLDRVFLILKGKEDE